jgi:hypothetical protein
LSYIGKTPTSVPLTSSDITDGIISLPKLTDGTDGNLISYDASGNPVAVATGTDGQVLTSTGAGSPPVFETPASATNTPAFIAKSSAATSIANSTDVKILYGTEVFDSDGCYASSRFTPTTAGKYFIRGSFRISSDADFTGLKIMIKKNGNAERVHQQSNWHYETVEIAAIVILNGSSDYVEIFGVQNSGGSVDTVNDDTYEHFEGYRILT